MKPHTDEQKSTQLARTTTSRRFRIEKLEERIAPAKGGYPGPPDGGGGNQCWGVHNKCCHSKHGCSI